MAGCLDFMKTVYDVFGFTFKLFLSTRPENYLGEIEMWDTAEKVRFFVCELNYNTKVNLRLISISLDKMTALGRFMLLIHSNPSTCVCFL